ncbi:MAG: M1 family peptidase, partial [Chitinophagaceae bacterium]|nr:M1 family peptidase [Chitinophagaceae bacterium]
YNGWDRIEFADALEFYNDFNDYTLNVTVPKNYIVWATGEFKNPGEVLQPAYIQKLSESMKSDKLIHVATKEDLATKNITIQNATNTWKWAWNNLTDVAFGLSDHFVWDASSVVVDNTTHRRASMQAAFNDSAEDYHHVVEFGQNALSYLSTTWPGVAYPFPKMTVFQGYAGMEYPMMANDETYSELYFTRFVEEHEISHTWFPFYMGINETRFAFMDEGWATTFELLYNQSVMSKDSAEMFYKQFRVNGWINDPSMDEDLPIITPGENLGQQALGNNEYGKPSLAYFAVKDMLGDDVFRKCLHGFMDRWHGKHPIPWDFFNTFNDISGKNLNWFWSNWFFSNNYNDLAIDNITKSPKGYSVLVKNVGGFVSPFDMQLSYTDGTSLTIHQTPQVWFSDQKQVTINIATGKTLQTARISGGIFVDADENNNRWEKK